MQYLCLEPTPMSYTQTQVVRLKLVFDQEENIWRNYELHTETQHYLRLYFKLVSHGGPFSTLLKLTQIYLLCPALWYFINTNLEICVIFFD